MLDKPRISFFFLNSFNKFNKTWALLSETLFIVYIVVLLNKCLCLSVLQCDWLRDMDVIVTIPGHTHMCF